MPESLLNPLCGQTEPESKGCSKLFSYLADGGADKSDLCRRRGGRKKRQEPVKKEGTLFIGKEGKKRGGAG